MTYVRWILGVLLLLATVQSTFYFLAVKKAGLVPWLSFNACAVANITFLAGLILFLLFKSRVVMSMAVLPLFFFGTGGLLVFPWGGLNIIPQIGHILMTANLIVFLLDLFKAKDFKAAAVGLLLGIFVFAWFLGFQQRFVYTYSEEFQTMMGPPLKFGNGEQPSTRLDAGKEKKYNKGDKDDE